MDITDYLHAFDRFQDEFPTEDANAAVQQILAIHDALNRQLDEWIQELKWDIQECEASILKTVYRELKEEAIFYQKRANKLIAEVKDKAGTASSFSSIREYVTVMQRADENSSCFCRSIEKQFYTSKYRKNEDDIFYSISHYARPLWALLVSHKKVMTQIEKAMTEDRLASPKESENTFRNAEPQDDAVWSTLSSKSVDNLADGLSIVVKIFGVEALKDKTRTLGALFDIAPSLKKLKPLVDSFFQCEGAKKLFDICNAHETEQKLVFSKLVYQLQSEYYLDGKAAAYVCQTFWDAIRVERGKVNIVN